MANINDLRDYVQHSHPKTIFQKCFKYDVNSDPKIVKNVIDTLWYTFNEESFQWPYADKTLTPSYLTDNKFDLMMQWRLALLLNIEPTSFIVESKKSDTVFALNTLHTFNTKSSLVMYYEKGKTSFIMKFLKSVRNSLAHGGFNKLQIVGKYNEIYLAAESYDKCLTKGVQLSIRLIRNYLNTMSFNDSLDRGTLLLSHAINDILEHKYKDVFSMFEENLMLAGYRVINKSLEEIETKNIICNVKVLKLRKKDTDTYLYYIEENDTKNIKLIINSIVIKIVKKSQTNLKNCVFYLVNGQPKLSKKIIEENCMLEMANICFGNDIKNSLNKNEFHLNILKKTECFYL